MRHTDDFFTDLESQLLHSAAARAAGTVRRLPPAWIRPSLTFAVTAAALAATVAVVTLTRDGTLREELPAVPTVTGTAGDCAVGQDVGRVIPFLRGEPGEEDRLPDDVRADVRRTMPNADLRVARRVATDTDGIGWRFYVVPNGSCDAGSAIREAICFVTYPPDGELFSSCLPFSDVRTAPRMSVQEVGDRAVAHGLVPAAATEVHAGFEGGNVRLKAREGIVSQLLPPAVSAESRRPAPDEWRYVDDYGREVEDLAGPLVTVLDATQETGAAEKFAARVAQAGWRVATAAQDPARDPAKSTVLYAEGMRDAAEELALDMKIETIESLDLEPRPEGDLVIVLGRDLAG